MSDREIAEIGNQGRRHPMSDHKAEAERLLGDAESFSDPRNGVNAGNQAAQVHATLYLAEQQRIGNLIAYGRGYRIQKRVVGSTVGHYMEPATTAEDANAVHAAIREGLGL